ncbi:MAG: 50S ribosomal protein L3 [Candidatus Marinimicrobia bacterium]|nr:50S ribosomal protein L3 [Candidatus Neomarinimicrobiota bacterium]|tara:strand:- start:3653 stop:4270 length:618 start_codon:yes stop_codon:yes gene_type:complete
MRGLLGKKIGMSRVFNSRGEVVPVTILNVGPCVVTQVKTFEIDGYEAVQIGYGYKKDKHLTRPLKGHFQKSSTKPSKVLAEFDIVPGFDYVLGSVFHVGLFNQGDFVRVSGSSKGRGFAGVIKRHNFSRQKKTHGTGHTERAPGSIGQASDPSRVFPGMRMAGRYGNVKVTIENLEVVDVDRENNHLIIKGSIPGPKGSIVTIEK